MANKLLEDIKKRRSITRFEKYGISDEEVQTILEAGRWAPLFANTQPWKFVVVKDPQTKGKLTQIASRLTISSEETNEASAIIVVYVDPEKDPDHYVEDGAAATQNKHLLLIIWGWSLIDWDFFWAISLSMASYPSSSSSL